MVVSHRPTACLSLPGGINLRHGEESYVSQQREQQREQMTRKQQTARQLLRACGPSGGLFGIDQEVVTLRGLSRQLPGQGLKLRAEVPRTNAFARPTRCLHPYSPASVRAVAPGAI
jgi:hypothetical protein